MKISSALKAAAEKLKDISDSALLDSEIILASVLKRERAWLSANPEKDMTLLNYLLFIVLINKREKGIPVAYITGHKEFFGRKFNVNRHVLIPRPDTEILLEATLEVLKQDASIENIIDVGTGSGCIAITLALENQYNIIATDISPQALRLAKKNAIKHEVKENIIFLKGNLLNPIIAKGNDLIAKSLIISNPPYIKTKNITKELVHEPTRALDGGKDGLQIYHDLLNQIAALGAEQKPSWLLLEIHPLSENDIRRMIKLYLPTAQTNIKQDLAGNARVAEIRI